MLTKEELEHLTSYIFKDFTIFADSLAKGKHPTLSPPFNEYMDKDNDILGYYHYIFSVYFKALEALGEETINIVNYTMKEFIRKNSNREVNFSILDEVKNLCNSILDATTQYLKGFQAFAFDKLESTMIKDECHLLNILPILSSSALNFFRVRKGKDLKERKELFHTPFELRGKCGSYRFSSLGYPSLYMAASMETAFLETNVKDPKDYFCSCFRPTKELSFIDLSLPNRDLLFWEHYSLLVFYPLIVACNLKVKKNDDPFKPEYIIPQLFVQIIRLHSNNIDGITYTSTRHKNISYTDFKQRNFVMYIPNAETEKGFSKELSKKLVSTIPVSCYIDDASTTKDLESLCLKQESDTIAF